MFSKMLKPIAIFCLLVVFFCASIMLSTEAWESGKRCDSVRNARWVPHACAGYSSESACDGETVEFKADPGDCVGDYTGWECDRNGPTKEYSVGETDCRWKTAKPPKKSVCADSGLPNTKDVPACRERKKS